MPLRQLGKSHIRKLHRKMRQILAQYTGKLYVELSLALNSPFKYRAQLFQRLACSIISADLTSLEKNDDFW